MADLQASCPAAAETTRVTRRRRRRRSARGRRPSLRPRRGAKTNTAKWRRNGRAWGKASETRWASVHSWLPKCCHIPMQNITYIFVCHFEHHVCTRKQVKQWRQNMNEWQNYLFSIILILPSWARTPCGRLRLILCVWAQHLASTPCKRDSRPRLLITAGCRFSTT